MIETQTLSDGKTPNMVAPMSSFPTFLILSSTFKRLSPPAQVLQPVMTDLIYMPPILSLRAANNNLINEDSLNANRKRELL